MVYPTPKWVFADAARYYSSEEYMDYLNRAGVGLTIAPAEAHWIMGFEESAINIAKGTVARLLREGSKFSVPDLFSLAAALMNAHVGPSGFSAFQWAFGAGGGPLDMRSCWSESTWKVLSRTGERARACKDCLRTRTSS
jgi:hypothetical protein